MSPLVLVLPVSRSSTLHRSLFPSARLNVQPTITAIALYSPTQSMPKIHDDDDGYHLAYGMMLFPRPAGRCLFQSSYVFAFLITFPRRLNPPSSIHI